MLSARQTSAPATQERRLTQYSSTSRLATVLARDSTAHPPIYAQDSFSYTREYSLSGQMIHLKCWEDKCKTDNGKLYSFEQRTYIHKGLIMRT